MIPTAFLQAWSVKAPWPDLRHVEQDLIISRALCDLFDAPALKDKMAFRRGTGIHKLELIAGIGGEGWKLAEPVLEELRVKRFPGLLMSRDQLRRA